jgi:hypothetical protein
LLTVCDDMQLFFHNKKTTSFMQQRGGFTNF